MALSYDSERNVVVVVRLVVRLFGHLLMTAVRTVLRLGGGLLRREEFDIVHDDVGVVAGYTVVVDPLVVLEVRFDEHLTSLPAVLADILGNLPERGHAVPVGLGDPLVTILLAARGSEPQGTHLQPTLRGAHLRVGTEVSSENHTISHDRLLC